MDIDFSLLENVELELELISLPLNFPNLAVKILDELTTDDFTNSLCKVLFLVYKKILQNGVDVELSTIYEYAYISAEEKRDTRLIDFCYTLQDKYQPLTLANLDRKITLLQEYTKKRNLTKACIQSLEILQHSEEITTEANLKAKELIQTELMKIDLIKIKKDSETIQEIGKEFSRNMEEQRLQENDNLPKYLLSIKYPNLARVLGGGLTRTNLILIAARPAMGKTTFTLELLLDLALRGYRVYFNSLEMSKDEVYRKLLTILTGIGNYYLKLPRLLTNEQILLVKKAIETLDKCCFIIDDRTGVKPIDIRNNLTKQKMKNEPIDVLAVDHIGLCKFDSNTSNRVHEIAEISRENKRIAKDFNLVFIEISQLNRSVELRSDKRPILADLKDSGSLEEDANQVLFLYRDAYYNKDTADKGITELNVAKNREGEIDTIKFLYAPRILSYQELETNDKY